MLDMLANFCTNLWNGPRLTDNTGAECFCSTCRDKRFGYRVCVSLLLGVATALTLYGGWALYAWLVVP